MRTKTDPIHNLPFDHRRRMFVRLEVPASGWIVRRLDQNKRIARRSVC
jgi:hypothetical protein